MAAGLGFKTFTTGEVLTAADVNGYLMQGILVFATEAARNSAITSPQEGQFAFTKDNNSLWYYTGSAWVASGATGDIEGVTAGVGISGGGTSGTVTITNDMATTITASGDIVVGTGSGTYDNLPIGSTGQVLTADTTVSPYKVKWAALGGSSFNTGVGYTSTSQGTTSGSYTDLATVTETTVTTGTKALVSLVFRASNNSAVSGFNASFAISGSTTVAADARYCVGPIFFDSSTNTQLQYGGTWVVTGLTAGSNTFTMKFIRQDGSGTVNFSQRSISVVDLGS